MPKKTISLKHSRVTDIKNGKCNNIDLFIMALGEGPAKTSDLVDLFRSFRRFDQKRATSNTRAILNTSKGFISKSYTNTKQFPISSNTSRYAKAYVYRVSRGVYALNKNGVKRFNELKKA